MTHVERSILLNCANKARAEADKFQKQFPGHALELRRIAEGVESVLRNTESATSAEARRASMKVAK